MAMMLGSADLLRAWVLSTLGGLATDDEHHARLRETLLIFLQAGGSYKTTAERLMLHKNTVQYRIRKAEESLGRRWASTSTTWNSRCGPATGWARPCCSRPENDHPLLPAPPRPGVVTAAEDSNLDRIVGLGILTATLTGYVGSGKFWLKTFCGS